MATAAAAEPAPSVSATSAEATSDTPPDSHSATAVIGAPAVTTVVIGNAVASTPDGAGTYQPPLGALTRADCLHLALVANRGHLITASAVERARLARTAARSQVYAPNLSAGYTVANTADSGNGNVGVDVPLMGLDIKPFTSLGYAQGTATGYAAGTTPLVDTYTTSWGVTVSRRLFNVAERVRQRLPLTEAEQNLYIAANNLALDAKNLELTTTDAFFEEQRAQAHLRVRERRVADAKDFLQTVADNVAHGFKAPFEELNARIDLNQAESDRLSEETNVQNAREHLAQVLALPPANGVTIVEEDVAGAMPPMPPLDVDIARTRAHDEGLGNRLASIAVQRDQLRVERDNLAPQVTAAVTAENVRTGTRAFERQGADANVYALSLTWTMPLDAQSGELARVREIQDQLAEADLALADAAEGVEVQLRAAWRNLAQLRNTVDLDRQRLDAEQGNMAATLTRYKSGAIDNLEVVRSKQDLDTAEIGLLDAQINLVEAVAAYRALLPMDAQLAAGAARQAAGAATLPAAVLVPPQTLQLSPSAAPATAAGTAP